MVIVSFRYNLPDTVVWNPWDSKAKEMEDFGDDEVYPEIFYNCHTFLPIRALAVPEHDLRERGPGVHPGNSAGWTSL